MIFTKKNGTPFLQFPALVDQPGLFHAVFTRHGGFSDPPFDSLNMSIGRGDDPQKIIKNRRKILECAGGGEAVFMEQVHGDEIWMLQAGKEAASWGNSVIPRADAAVTDVPGMILVVQGADCQPIFLYDPMHQVIANVHAGWRGSIRGIVGKTVRSMSDTFGCRPESIIACIGPSLGPCCAEFTNYMEEIPPSFWIYKNRRNFFDFWSITRDQLIDEGLSGNNVHTSGLCTRCRTDLFFSYRSRKTTGRFASVIGLCTV